MADRLPGAFCAAFAGAGATSSELHLLTDVFYVGAQDDASQFFTLLMQDAKGNARTRT